ncbi:hypothetical protein M3_0124 [Lysinibacillus phage vB_LfM_LysYB1]|nr:hypothetical protein M3_0124 [Lysinibacillus phage vB_LfM_LysYB1]WAB25366.1 hypothetical protein M5_0188 [Lysinibacillus phage vB_LfM_LysYB2]
MSNILRLDKLVSSIRNDAEQQSVDYEEVIQLCNRVELLVNCMVDDIDLEQEYELYKERK